MRIEPLCEEFVVHLSLERNLAETTIISYEGDVRVFCRALDEFGIPHEIEKIDTGVVRRYIRWMGQRDYQPRTVGRHISSLRAFFKFLELNDYTNTNPVRGIPLPKKPHTLPKSLTEDECRRLIDATAAREFEFYRIRDRAMLTFMLYTGPRRSEVRNLRLQDVDFENGTVRFAHAKGDKTRVVPLADRAKEALLDWLEIREDCDHDYVFTSRRRTQVAARGMGSALRKALEAAGINKPDITLHNLRHSFATLMVRNGADLPSIQRMLGHTRLDTTGIYLQATAEDLKDAMKHHPLSKPKDEDADEPADDARSSPRKRRSKPTRKGSPSVGTSSDQAFGTHYWV